MITLQERVHKAKPKYPWNLNKIHHVLNVRSNNKNKGMINDNLLSLSYGKIVNKNIDSAEGLLPESFETYQIVQSGDIVMRLTDLQNDKRSIRQGLVKEQGIITSAYDAVYPTKGHDSRYWAYTLLALDLAKYYYSLGGGVRQSIKFKDFPNDWIYTPPTETQKEIADFLDRETARIDTLIEKKERLLKIIQEKKNSLVIYACLGIESGKVATISDNKNVIQELVHGYKTPDNWEIHKVHNVFNLRKNNKNIGMIEENLLSLSYGNIVRKDINNNEGLLPESYETYQIVQLGDIVLRLTDLQNDKKSIRQGLVKEKGIITSAYDAVFVGFNHDPRFWAYTLLSLDLAKYYYSLGGGVRQSIKFKDIPNMWVKVPNKKEQSIIADKIDLKVDRVNQLTHKTKESIEKLKQFRTSLITEAVTGQLDIKAWKKKGGTDKSLDVIQEKMAS